MDTRQVEASVRGVNEDKRLVTFVASTSTKDRHGTVLNQNNWQLDRFNSNPVIGYQHNVYGGGFCEGPDPDDVIGKGRAYVEELRDHGGSELLIDIEFEDKDLNPKADKVYRNAGDGRFVDVSSTYACRECRAWP